MASLIRRKQCDLLVSFPGELGLLPLPELNTKYCSRCRTRKPVVEFHLCTDSPDGRQSYCKTCKHDHGQDRAVGIRNVKRMQQALIPLYKD